MGASGSSGNRASHAERSSQNQSRGGGPQIRCYQCQGIFTTTQGGQLLHVRCPYCSTINGVPSSSGAGGSTGSSLQGSQNNALNAAAVAAATSAAGDLSPAALARQEQLLRRLQAREITPLELLILREFVEHLQQTRAGASSSEIDSHTASWVVQDVQKIPEELRSCCVCLEDVCVGNKVRTLPCLHTFHAECAEEWLKKKKVCPLCQFSIDGEPEAVDAPADAAA